MEPEIVIANFLKPPSEGGAYTDEKLAALLAHAEDGKLSYFSCCCFIGIPTADHALRGRMDSWDASVELHYQEARFVLGADGAEDAFIQLDLYSDAGRRAKLIPLIKSEMQRREFIVPLLKAEIELEVGKFRAFCEQGAPTPEIRSDQSTYNDIAVRAFTCGAEWANMPESKTNDANAVSGIVDAVLTGYKAGLAIRERNAADDTVLSASQIG